MTDEELENSVADALVWDPRVDSNAIAVQARGGAVTLQGTVESYSQRYDANWEALHVRGVTRVVDEMQVAVPDAQRRDDEDLRGAALAALMHNNNVPDTVDVQVHAGEVTLTGSVRWHYQRLDAERVVRSLSGVADLVDRLDIVAAEPRAGNLRHAIVRAMRRRAGLDATDVSVTVTGDTVTLCGTVPSWADRDAAVRAVWSAPGVARLTNEIRVRS